MKKIEKDVEEPGLNPPISGNGEDRETMLEIGGELCLDLEE